MPRDHMLGFPSLAAVSDEADLYTFDFPSDYPLGVPQRVREEARGFSRMAEAFDEGETLAERTFRLMPHPYPDGRHYDIGKLPAARVSARVEFSGFNVVVEGSGFRRIDCAEFGESIKAQAKAGALVEAMQEAAAAALLYTSSNSLRARTPAQAADRIGEAFAHMSAAERGTRVHAALMGDTE